MGPVKIASSCEVYRPEQRSRNKGVEHQALVAHWDVRVRVQCERLARVPKLRGDLRDRHASRNLHRRVAMA